MNGNMWIVCCLLCSVAVLGRATPYKTAKLRNNVNMSTNGMNPAGHSPYVSCEFWANGS